MIYYTFRIMQHLLNSKKYASMLELVNKLFMNYL